MRSATISPLNVLVTGGAGYIGSHVAKALAQAGHTPVTYDSLVRGSASAIRWGPVVVADLADSVKLEEAIRDHKIDAIIHLAAFAYVGESMREPGLYFRNNTVSSLGLFEVARRTGVERLVFSSTCATYGDPDYVPIDENHPQRPVNPYGESKLLVEKLLRWYGDIHGLRWVVLRYFNAAGADPDQEIGEDHDPETHLIPLVIDAALDPGKPVAIFGTDYDTPDGTAVRDYIHVSDLATAHVKALQYLTEGGASRPFNLGTGEGHSVRKIVEAVASVSGRRPAVREADRRLGDPAVLVANPSLARTELDWQPSRSDLFEMVRTAWQWRSEPATRNGGRIR